MKDETGELCETPDELIKRVASAVANAEYVYPNCTHTTYTDWYNQFYQIIDDLEFLPNSPTLMNAGRSLGQLSACFVLPVEDNMVSIFDAVKYTAIIHKSGGGTGFSFSKLRPSRDVVKSTRGISSGPVSFMSVFDCATQTIKQGGTRRGANMGILRCDHPDIFEFITCKESGDRFNNFNISVAVTNKFMTAVVEDTHFALINPRTGYVVATHNARKIFDLIVQQAWKTGDPGIIFIDELNLHNPTPTLGSFEATNPCGEQPLLSWESCNLGSINLATMIRDGFIDYENLTRVVKIAVRFLDNVITINNYPVKEIEDATLQTRKIGLGVMGFSDMLVKLNTPYDSEEALGIACDVMSTVNLIAKKESAKLGAIRGKFPASTTPANWVQQRNATVTTIAPTGSISILANCSSGIEPFFALAMQKNILDGEKLIEVNPTFEHHFHDHANYKAILDHAMKSGSVQDCVYLTPEEKRLFKVSHEISADWHVRMQAEFQKHTDNAVSKTINLPNSATQKDVSNSYMLAYKLKCKGITIYRDKSRDAQVLEKGTGATMVEVVGLSTESTKIPIELPSSTSATPKNIVVPKRRAVEMKGVTRKIETSCGSMYVTINFDENGNPFEVFTMIGKAGGCARSQSEAIGRLISLCLRVGIAPNFVVRQLKGITCHLPRGLGPNRVSSCADAVGQALEEALQVDQEIPIAVNGRGACPECSSTVEYEGGCCVCRNCGWSEC